MKKRGEEKSPREMAREHLELGKFYFLNQRYGEAIEQLKKALGFDEDDADIYFNLGVVYEAINQVADAKENFEKALDLQPDMKSAQEHLDRLVGV
ncbi:MAG: tetratricopeptide repeat protein [Thermoplasmata archaeon]